MSSVDIDLYGDAVVEDSADAFRRIRDAGPVVRLPRNRMWAMGRFEDVRAALRNDELFTSDGVGANPLNRVMGRKSILFSNGKTHDARRNVMMRSLAAKALLPTAERLDQEADAIVKGLVGVGEFDAVRDFSSGLPLRVVAELVGLPVPSDRLLHWGTKTFDVLGPLNRRWRGAVPTMIGIVRLHAGPQAVAHDTRQLGCKRL